jgi:hypothetical protein
VIHLPNRDSLLDSAHATGGHFEKAKEFASALGAQFLDGRQVFAGRSPAEIRGLFFPQDGHWNQQGSDLFAEMVVRHLDLFHAPPRATSSVRIPPALPLSGPADLLTSFPR